MTGPDGLLKLFTKNVLETALNEEMTEHLGHGKNQADPARESTNVSNGSRPKTVVSDAAGEVTIDLPRDRERTFEPQIVRKRQRRLTDVDEIVLSLYAKGILDSTGQRNTVIDDHGGGAGVGEVGPSGHDGRGQAGVVGPGGRGESISQIARAILRPPGSVFTVIKGTGGYAPAPRRRRAGSLTLAESVFEKGRRVCAVWG